MTVMRDDDYHVVEHHRGQFQGQTALIVLGGPSGKDWERLYEELNPDVLIGVNAVGANTDKLDFWLCTENMNYPFQQAFKGNERYQEMMRNFNNAKAKVRIVNKKSIGLLTFPRDVVKIQRWGREVEHLDNFTFREYGNGLINGARMQRQDRIRDLRVGTVGLQALHWAGILGVSEVHTIGFDLCYRKEDKHHWYKYPLYIQDGKYWYGDPFTTYKGIKTTWFWVDTVAYFHHILPVMERDELNWIDHSDGLLQAEGLR